jgi:hypothetical protein
MEMLRPPLPHPLDFDWRYADATSLRLASMLMSTEPVLCIGAPKVARLLEDRGIDVTLVDRQPFQKVRRHLAMDVCDFEPDRRYRAALVDPPWYQVFLRSWSQSAARAVGSDGTVLLSVWPETTRPGARTELDALLSEIGDWGEVERNVARLDYEVPLFENVARSLSEAHGLSRSPGVGELVRIRVREAPRRSHSGFCGTQWLRFVFDDYQLALKLEASRGTNLIERVPGVNGWLWPYVSARAPGRADIGLWSSHGEVARTGAPLQVAEAMRSVAIARDLDDFDRAFAAMPDFKSWRIPRPPYRRFAEWLHRQ